MSIDWKKACTNATSALHAAMEAQIATLDMLIKSKYIDKKVAHLILDKIARRKDFQKNEFAQNVIQAYKDFLDGKIDPTDPGFDMTNIIKFPSKKK
jgi:hypothetical protein